MGKSYRKFLDALGVQPAPGLAAHPAWRPAADVYRTNKGWLVKLDLAGVNPADIRLECQDSVVVVSGMRRDATVHQSLSSYSMEISYNRFERRLDLPGRIEAGGITTEYQDGMLLIWVPEKS